MHQLPNGTGVVDAIREHNNDAAVLDIETPEVDGITSIDQIIKAFGNDIAVLILTTFGRTQYLPCAMSAGARASWSKTHPPNNLLMLFGLSMPIVV